MTDELLKMEKMRLEETEIRSADLFTIPELPEGKTLEVRLLSNWGDSSSIGLNSIELFTVSGERARVQKISTDADSYNGSLEELLTEQMHRRRDPQRMFCAPIPDDGKSINIRIEMHEITKFALIRFWNYNTSRVHAQIGVRDVEMRLDGRLIFIGELECSFSADSEFTPQMGETVLFTTDERILEDIAAHDVCLIDLPPEELAEPSSAAAAAPLVVRELDPYRPATCESKELLESPVVPVPPPPPTPCAFQVDVKVLHLELLSNWGMEGLIGLTGIEIVDDSNRVVEPHSFSVVASDGSPPEHVARLFNGNNLTRNPTDMWLVETDGARPVTVTVTFHRARRLKAVSVWNYNASFELSYAGVATAHFYANGRRLLEAVRFRKATGFVYFDYVQDFMLDPNAPLFVPRPIADGNCVGGFVFQLRLLSTWGDEYYIGLNGIELYNRYGQLMKLRMQNLAAFPESINSLSTVKNDWRTSNNIITQPNDTDIPKHMWLTALIPNRCCRVFFIFDFPTYVSKMVIYNYRKTPSRGVRHFSLSVDDLIIFSGEVPESSEVETGKLEINMDECT